MNSILSNAAAWWDARTLREQRMVMIGGGLLLAVIVWLGVVRPLWTWREDAADDRALAEADQQRVAVALARLAPSDAPAAGPAPDLQAVVAEVGAQTGLTPVMGMAGDGNLGFSLSDISTAAAFGWLSALRDRGVDAVSLSVVENTDATLTVEGSLAAAP